MGLVGDHSVFGGSPRKITLQYCLVAVPVDLLDQPVLSTEGLVFVVGLRQTAL